jgi:hypothetical protein
MQNFFFRPPVEDSVRVLPPSPPFFETTRLGSDGSSCPADGGKMEPPGPKRKDVYRESECAENEFASADHRETFSRCRDVTEFPDVTPIFDERVFL